MTFQPAALIWWNPTSRAQRHLESPPRLQLSNPVPGLRQFLHHAPDPGIGRQRQVVDAFFAAAHRGDFDALVAVLHPDVVLRSDGGTARPAASVVVHGAAAVAARTLTLAQRSVRKRPALVNGAAGVVVTVAGQPVAVLGFTVSRGKIVEIDAIMGTLRVPMIFNCSDEIVWVNEAHEK
jgi:ketosteroid isomerase-like protein